MTEHSQPDVIDWDDAFDNGSYVPGSSAFPEQWRTRAESWRNELRACGRLDADIRYGDRHRQALDIFRPEGVSRGLVVIVHGGYWHKFYKDDWSHLSAGCLAHGWSVAIPGYRLAPDVSVPQITHDVSTALGCAAERIDGPIRVVGHSAGGHLVTRLLCADVPVSPRIVRRLVHVVAVSGIYDLRPLLRCRMNDILQLGEAEAMAESPALQQCALSTPLTLWVGDEERPEYLRQIRLLSEKWEHREPAVSSCYEKGKNHFSVIDALTDPGSALVSALLRQ
ncbi:MAG: alpha/beta hydrolase [Granulosicoccus sp.]|nr:alpha/beta hydrolase [Granulosicoccus sp.]